MPFIDDFKTLRLKAGLRKSAVAKAAGLSEDTITRIEKHVSVSEESLRAAVNALNNLYFDRMRSSLNADVLITAKTSFGEGKSTPDQAA